MAKGYLVVGSTDGMEWPSRPLRSDIGGAIEQVWEALRDVGLEEFAPAQIADLAVQCDAVLRSGHLSWSYGEPWDEHGATASWSIAVVVLPYA